MELRSRRSESGWEQVEEDGANRPCRRIPVGAVATMNDTTPTLDTPPGSTDPDQLMGMAIAAAQRVRVTARPNPWVGAVVLSEDGIVIADGATEPVGGRHAEVVALEAAGERARGGTLVVTLEPCSHHGRTPPCVDAVIAAGVARVLIGVEDPDPRVSGQGVRRLREAGVEVTTGVASDTVAEQLAAYLHQRRTGRPMVIAKMAATLDGRTAAPDGTSNWISGEEARREVHQMRAESDVVLVGAGTVRADDPRLTVRDADGPDPLRVVLGAPPEGAKVHPCLEWTGAPEALLDQLGAEGHLQLLVEGGAETIATLLERDLVDCLVVYLAPSIHGGSSGHHLVGGVGATTISELRRGRFLSVRQVGEDIRVEFDPRIGSNGEER